MLKRALDILLPQEVLTSPILQERRRRRYRRLFLFVYYLLFVLVAKL